MKTAIIDIDGTISDSRHRLHHINGKHRDYEAFHSQCSQDPVIEPVALLVNMIAQDGTVVLLTGRPNRFRENTQDWLDDNAICYDELIMKADGNTRPNVEYKLDVLQQLRARGHEVFLAIDDQDGIAEMWRANGIHCLQTRAI
jgi:uncharacterized HAD superfamily protein